MLNAEDNAKTLQVRVEKLIQKTPKEVFRAIGEGRLFLNCGADHESLEIDFKLGGKYSLQFLAYGLSKNGEFLEIIPNQKIAFTWCQKSKVSAEPDTVVTIDLLEKQGYTLLILTHTGFSDQETTDDHDGGWNSSIGDLATEMVQGQLKFTRLYKFPVEKLYELCKTPATFFGMLGDLSKGKVDFKVGGLFHLPTEGGEIAGKFTEITPNKKIEFTWEKGCDGTPLQASKVTLLFDTEEEGQSWLELQHSGLMTEANQKSHREGWDWLLAKMMT
jgi:uncharacterized protein YndB with AHSA1/START domain